MFKVYGTFKGICRCLASVLADNLHSVAYSGV
jgi:hypothetical protein